MRWEKENRLTYESSNGKCRMLGSARFFIGIGTRKNHGRSTHTNEIGPMHIAAWIGSREPESLSLFFA